MLMTDMLKHTWHQHQDYDDLQKAVTKLGDVAKTLNEEKVYSFILIECFLYFYPDLFFFFVFE